MTRFWADAITWALFYLYVLLALVVLVPLTLFVACSFGSGAVVDPGLARWVILDAEALTYAELSEDERAKISPDCGSYSKDGPLELAQQPPVTVDTPPERVLAELATAKAPQRNTCARIFCCRLSRERG